MYVLLFFFVQFNFRVHVYSYRWNDLISVLVSIMSISSFVYPLQAQLCNPSGSIPMDIIFGIDASGSFLLDSSFTLRLDPDGFPAEKEFIKNVSLLRLSDDTKMGYTMFATDVNETRPLQFWNESDLSLFIDGLSWINGFTNTPGLIESSILQFNENLDPEIERRLIIVTDGNPCPDLNNCPISVCQYQTQLQSLGIKTAIIYFGNIPINRKLTDCIADYSIPFESVTNNNLSDILCVIPEEFEAEGPLITNRYGTQWWYSIVISDVPSNITISSIRFRHYGINCNNQCWEKGDYDKGGGDFWSFRLTAPFIGPFSFNITSSTGQNIVSYDIIQSFQIGESVRMYQSFDV